MAVLILKHNSVRKHKRFNRFSSDVNKTTQSACDSVDFVLNKYIKHRTHQCNRPSDKKNELDRLEYSISQLPFLKNNKIDLLNKNIYDFINSSIKHHESNPAGISSNLSNVSTQSGCNDLNNLLLQASFWGNLADITHCLDLGADVNYFDQVGRSAIHYSTASGALDCVEFLINRGANINTKDLKSWTCLHIAVTKNYTSVAKLLLEAGADVKALLKHRCAPSRIKDIYSSCIHFAAIKGNIETTKLLTDMGLSINDRDSANLTPLDYAAFRKNYKYLKFLVENGAKIDNLDINHRTALHSAALGGHVENFRLLHSKGCNPKIRDNWGFTPYDLAVLKNHEKLVQFMCKINCNIRGIDGVGGSFGPSLSDNSLANAIAIALQESKVDTIARVVKCLGSELCLKLLEASLAVDRKGGMMTADGRRKRSRGGIFFFLLKELHKSGHVSDYDFLYIKTLDKESKPRPLEIVIDKNIRHNSKIKKGATASKKTPGINNAANVANATFPKFNENEISTAKRVTGKKSFRDAVVKTDVAKCKQSNGKKLESSGAVDVKPSDQLDHQMQLLKLLKKFQEQLNINNANTCDYKDGAGNKVDISVCDGKNLSDGKVISKGAFGRNNSGKRSGVGKGAPSKSKPLFDS